MRAWRTVAGVVLLLVLAVVGARLVPLYLKNFQLQDFLNDTVEQASSATAPPDMLRVAVAERASRLGLPVHTGQVRVERSGGSVVIEVRYSVPVDFLLYSVDLHFRPRASGRS